MPPRTSQTFTAPIAPATKRIFAGILTATLMSGCVTTHDSVPTKLTNDGAIITSCSESRGFKHSMFARYICTLQNTSVSWRDVAITDIEVSGARLATQEEARLVYESAAQELLQSEFNNGLLLTSIIVGGVLLAAAAPDGSGAKALGGAAALGSTATQADKAVKHAGVVAKETGAKEIRLSNGEPAKLRIPPKSYVTRAILMELEEPNRKPKVLKMCVDARDCACMTITREGRKPEYRKHPNSRYTEVIEPKEVTCS